MDNRLSMHSHFRFGQIRIYKTAKLRKKDVNEQADDEIPAKIFSLFIKNNKKK
jgi:hypothetical protein